MDLLQVENPHQIEAIGESKLKRIEGINGNVEYFSTPLEGLIVYKHKVYYDTRGNFREAYNPIINENLQNIVRRSINFCQINISQSLPTVARGFHFEPEDKLINVRKGMAVGAWVDLRDGSRTEGEVFIKHLKENESIFIPAGVANAFFCLEGYEDVEYLYLVSEPYLNLPKGNATPLLMTDNQIAHLINRQLIEQHLRYFPQSFFISDRDKEGLALIPAFGHFRRMSLELEKKKNGHKES